MVLGRTRLSRLKKELSEAAKCPGSVTSSGDTTPRKRQRKDVGLGNGIDDEESTPSPRNAKWNIADSIETDDKPNGQLSAAFKWDEWPKDFKLKEEVCENDTSIQRLFDGEP